MLATYIHNMDPVIFDIVGPIKLRWYGMGYLLAFVSAYYLLCWLARKKLWVLTQDKVADFIAYGAFLGVFLGGRLGYILFYQVPKEGGMQQLINDPLMVVRVWDGGMASHGGILGLVIFTYFYARHHKVSWTGVGDGLCVVAPIGIGLVRIANFINGELYGRLAHGSAWGIKFPSSLHEDLKGQPEKLDQAYAECQAVDPSLAGQSFDYLLAQSRENSELLETLGSYLQARHPSQLYEAFLEGAVLFMLLLVTRVRFPRLPNGIITGMFFVFYAVFRIVVEGFREPDSAMIGALTKGQFYSLFMVVGGLAFIVTALARQKKKL